MNLPNSTSEAARWTLIGVAVVLVAIVAIYAVVPLLAVAVWVVVLVVVGVVLWAVGGRVWDAIRHGKPLIRGDWKGGEDGGD